MNETVEGLKQQLLQLRGERDSGRLNAAQYRKRRAPLERALADAVLAGSPARAEAPAGAAPAAGLKLWVGLAAFAVAVAALGYWWTGSPRATSAAAGPDGPAAAASAPHALDAQQFNAMVERLAARLQAQPDDAEGWSMLGRSYMALDRIDEALAAFEHLARLRPDNADVLADQADALAMKNGRSLDGEPTRLVERALQLDPNNLKALMLAGTAAFNRGAYAQAATYWERAVRAGPPDSPMVQQARGAAAEARERGKLPPAVPQAPNPPKASAATAPAAAPPAGALAATLSGTVSLAPALQGRVSPDDVLFVFARPAEGPRMPLAIVRAKVSDLPYRFSLDDSQAMSPATRLSSVPRAVVGARISKSGQAMPQSGDLEGFSPPAALGSSGLSLVIDSVVK